MSDETSQTNTSGITFSVEISLSVIILTSSFLPTCLLACITIQCSLSSTVCSYCMLIHPKMEAILRPAIYFMVPVFFLALRVNYFYEFLLLTNEDLTVLLA